MTARSVPVGPFRFPLPEAEAITTYADIACVSKGEFIRRAVRAYIRNGGEDGLSARSALQFISPAIDSPEDFPL